MLRTGRRVNAIRGIVEVPAPFSKKETTGHPAHATVKSKNIQVATLASHASASAIALKTSVMSKYSAVRTPNILIIPKRASSQATMAQAPNRTLRRSLFNWYFTSRRSRVSGRDVSSVRSSKTFSRSGRPGSCSNSRKCSAISPGVTSPIQRVWMSPLERSI